MGLTSDRNFEHSCEVFRRGDAHRRIVYGKTRDQVLADLADDAHGDLWMDDYVVLAKRIPMGLGRAWERRGLCRDD